jgi:hypothetical protein
VTRRVSWILVGLTGLLSWALSQTGQASGSGFAVQSDPGSRTAVGQLADQQSGSRELHSAPNADPGAPRGSPADVLDWLEPRSISVFDLVGHVPEAYLQGMIVSYESGSGIVVYESGSLVGDAVVVTTTIYPRVHTPYWPPHNLVTLFGCLGQKPFFDHMGSIVPESTLRVYDSSGLEVTSQIEYMDITVVGLDQPIAGSGASVRYPVQGYGDGRPNPLPIGPDGLAIPPNSGCLLVQPGVDNYPLTGVFTADVASTLYATTVATQQASFLSYIGPGHLGIFQPLMDQLRSIYPDRNDRIPLSAPPEANYFLVKYPPQPGDPYADLNDGIYDNADRPSSGSYRLSRWVYLSTDLVFSGAFPLSPAWEDADRFPGADFLPLLTAPDELAAPEYVLPAGIPYNDCFTQGNCSPGVLEQIYNTEMMLDIVYLSVSEPQIPGNWLSLRFAGPAWTPSALPGVGPSGSTASPPPTIGQEGPIRPPGQLQDRGGMTDFAHVVYLPFVYDGPGPDEPIDCPCGWFDSLGRMLYYLPGP